MLIVKNKVPRKYLRTIEVPDSLPEYRSRGETTVWTPLQHGEVADGTIRALRDRGFGIKREAWGLCRGDRGLIGTIDLECPRGLKNLAPKDGGLSFGVRHSNDGWWALSCLVGARIFICENGQISSEFAMTRKHTNRIDLGEVLEESIERYIEQARDLSDMQSRFMDAEMTTLQADHILVESVVRKDLPAKLAPAVAKEWREPRHREFRDRNAWSLYMAFTEIAKERPPIHQARTIESVGHRIEAAIAA